MTSEAPELASEASDSSSAASVRIVETDLR